MSIITRSGSIGRDESTGGLVKSTLVSELKISSHASIKATNSRPVRYNRKIRKNSESIGIPNRLQRVLVLEQSVNK